MASLLKTAEELRIKGLAEVSWRDDDNENTESNDNNNNNVTESNTSSSSFPLLAQTSSSSSTTSSSTHHLQSNHQQQSHHQQQQQQQQQQSQVGPSPSGNGSDRKEYDKENMLKAIPFLAPLSSPKDLSSSASRKKRGRPPLDDSNSFTKT